MANYKCLSVLGIICRDFYLQKQTLAMENNVKTTTIQLYKLGLCEKLSDKEIKNVVNVFGVWVRQYEALAALYKRKGLSPKTISSFLYEFEKDCIKKYPHFKRIMNKVTDVYTSR